MILNELLHNMNLNKDNLVMTVIDFTKAFRSVPYELIMSTMMQRNFPDWTQKIVLNIDERVISVIKMIGRRIETIE
jgi:hypothetical protein